MENARRIVFERRRFVVRIAQKKVLVANDLMEPDDNLVQLSQRGLGLPSLDMYQDDPLLTQYSQHVSQMLELAEDVTGVPPGGYEDMARSVVDFEQALAQIFLPGQLLYR